MTKVAKQKPPETASALVPITIEGWSLFQEGESFWIRDLDLAAQAGLAVPRDIRRTIAKCAADLGGVGSGHATDSPIFRTVDDVVPSGDRGASQVVTAYYLNREAALHVIMRLRTPRAVDLQIAVVRVFLRALEGPPMPPALVSKANGKPLTKRQAEVLEYLKAYAEQFGASPSYREIGAHFGWTSTNAVHDHLAGLERKGAIRLRGEGKARGIILPREPPPAPAPPPAPLPSAAPPNEEIAQLRRMVEQLVGAVASAVAAIASSRPRRAQAAEGQHKLPFPTPA